MDRQQYIIQQFCDPVCRTMQDIADELGVSRQRIQQILKKNNISRTDGGKTVQTQHAISAKKAAQNRRRERSIQRQFGCDEQTALNLNSGQKLNKVGTPAYKYISYKRNCIHHHEVEFDLTFPEWYDIWQKSGKYSQIGVGKGSYCMARIDRDKPITADNVEIMPSDQTRLKDNA